jgi:heme-degrading monooxygenase HmoA
MSMESSCYAVIFSSQRRAGADGAADDGYEQAADQMLALAAQQPGYLGVESARGSDGFGITVSYWASEQAIRDWKQVAEHRAVQTHGREHWYVHYQVRIARVERAYGFEAGAAGPEPAASP